MFIDLTQATINRGRYTICYTLKTNCVLNSIDIIKEGYALFLPEGKHLPKIERLSFEWFLMPRYNKLHSKYKTACKQVKLIQKAFNKHAHLFSVGYTNSYSVIERMIETVSQDDSELTEALTILLNAASNAASELMCDFKLENFSVTKDGELILRDLFADYRSLREKMLSEVVTHYQTPENDNLWFNTENDSFEEDF